jgi:predicted nucleotidyltransferase
MQNNAHPLIDIDLSDIKKDILAVLAYFDLFNYPLTRAEVYLFLKQKHHPELVTNALACLLENGVFFQFDRFYTLKNDQHLVIRRNAGNDKAAELIKIAERVSSLLILFPFVTGVAISGSLSKNYADEFSDIDLFIITETNRLWIARTLMHCFKKLTFLFNKEHLFCMNYYIDLQGLQIAEKNTYTAIEVGTLMPLQGDLVFEKFYAANTWIRHFIPNKTMRISSAKPVKNSVFKAIFEYLINLLPANFIDDRLMKITSKRWSKKTIDKKLNSHGMLLGMLASKHCSKPDPVNFQGKLLMRYDSKVSKLLHDYEGSLAH